MIALDLSYYSLCYYSKWILDIGDFTGIVALVATAITFALTYRYGSQSEQTRLARDTWKKVS
jgi:hypothetical protein